MTATIATHLTLEAYFHELVAEALEQERVKLTAAAHIYVIQLVTEFTHREALHAGGNDDESGTPALFRLYEHALNSAPRERFNAYRHLGDVALVVSGFFGQHIEQSNVSVRYYVEMGGTGYRRAASLATGGGFAPLLAQLAAYFERLVEVLTRVAEKTTLPVARDVIALYERWSRNPTSAHLGERLLSAGAIPIVGSDEELA